jgi:SAM-dependent methyltransferase
MSGAVTDSNKDYLRWKGWKAEDFGRFTVSDDVYYAAELRRAGICSGRILEIGFGNGGFAAWAKDRACFEYHGTEMDHELVARARVAGFNALDAGASWAAPNSFDAIVAFDVLEHVPIADLAHLFACVRDSLRSGGRLVARFPSGDSPFARHIQYGDVAHSTVIGTGIVQQLALGSGLKVVQIRSPVLPVWGLGPRTAIRRAGLLMLRAVIGRILQIAFFDNIPRVITANMVIVLAKP